MKKRRYKITADGMCFVTSVSDYLRKAGILEETELERPFNLGSAVFYTKPLTLFSSLKMALRIGILESDKFFGGKATIEQEVL